MGNSFLDRRYLEEIQKLEFVFNTGDLAGHLHDAAWGRQLHSVDNYRSHVGISVKGVTRALKKNNKELMSDLELVNIHGDY